MTTMSTTKPSEAKARPRSILELLAQWRDAKPLGSENQLPDIIDTPLEPVTDLE